MKFQNPVVFWLLLAVPLLLILWRTAGVRSARQIHKLVAARLHQVLVGVPTGRLLRFLLLLVAFVLAVVAWARPQHGEVAVETKGRGRDVIIVVDVSRSMLATDIPPSRLARAKLAAEDLVRQLPSDRIGLVAFAGSAFLQAPVTADHSAVLTAMRELDPELIPLPGTNISAALHCADEAFDRTEGGQRAVVLITDGEDLEADAVGIARELSVKMRIFTVGVGSPEGSVLMVPGARGGVEYIRDEAGNVVQSKLDETRLRELADAGGGFYTHLISGPTEMRRIAKDGIGAMAEHDVLAQSSTRAVERFQWLLGLSLLALGAGMLLGEGSRRGNAAAISVLTILGLLDVLSPVSHAVSNAKSLYEAGNFPGAQQAFAEELRADQESPERAFNLGTAAYKNQKWPEAIEAFGKALNSRDPQLRKQAEYNLANTLVQQARQGRRGEDKNALQQAIAHYNAALNRDPDFEDAKHNRDFVAKLLEAKPPQQQKQEKGDKSEKKDEKNKDDKEKQQDKSEDQSDQSKDGEKPDGDQGEGKEGEGQQKQDGSKGQKPQKDGQQSAQNGQQPEPIQEKPGDEKERGELKDSPLVDRPEEAAKRERERQAQMARDGNGKMTKEQAAALLEALRSEDRRVQVWAPNRAEVKEASRSAKTW